MSGLGAVWAMHGHTGRAGGGAALEGDGRAARAARDVGRRGWGRGQRESTRRAGINAARVY